MHHGRTEIRQHQSRQSAQTVPHQNQERVRTSSQGHINALEGFFRKAGMMINETDS
jgi:hypothetical protein